MSEDFKTMVATLRGALESPSDAGRPGQLRVRMEAALGSEESRRLRRLIHQVVGAAEENLPANLRRIAPLTSESLQRLSGELAESRGWSQEAAQRATQIWAAALGFGDLAASSWPREPAPGRPLPAERPTPVVAATAPPPAAAPRGTPEPTPEPAKRIIPPRAGQPQHATPPAAPRPADPPRVPAASVPGTPTDWPKPHKQLGPKHPQTRTGEPTLTTVLGYSGMNLIACAVLLVLLTVVLCAPIVILGASGFLLPLLGVLGASLLVAKLGRGALVASASGLEFTPYDRSGRKAFPDKGFSAPWHEVTVEPGYVTKYRFAGHTVQVGPRNKAFVAAAQPYVGGSAG